jgi:hypothetical protein
LYCYEILTAFVPQFNSYRMNLRFKCSNVFTCHSNGNLLVGKPEGKRPLGRPRCRWIDNIKMDLLGIGLNVVDWVGLAQDRYRWRALVNSVMNFRVP